MLDVITALTISHDYVTAKRKWGEKSIPSLISAGVCCVCLFCKYVSDEK